MVSEIISLESDIEKLLTVAERSLPYININKHKADILEKTASIYQLSGKSETAAYCFEKAYNAEPSVENLKLLLDSSLLFLGTGNTEKSYYLSDFVIKNTSEKELVYKAELIISYIEITSGKSDKAETLLKKLADYNDIDDQLLFSIYKIADWYGLKSVKEKAGKNIAGKYRKELLDELDKYEYPLNPLFLFNYFKDYNATVKKTDGKIYAYIQTGVFSSLNNAENMVSRIAKAGLTAKVREETKNNSRFYKVIIAAETEEIAEYYNIVLKEHKIESFMVFD